MTLAGGLHLIVSQRLVSATDGKSVVAAVELLPGSVALWSLIRDNKTFQIPSLQQRGKGFGIVRLDDSLYELVKAGRIPRRPRSRRPSTPRSSRRCSRASGRRRAPRPPLHNPRRSRRPRSVAGCWARPGSSSEGKG